MPTFTRDRATIAYDIEGTGPPLVIINGITDHRNSIPSLKLRQTFAERYTVLSLDNRGAGQTVTESGAPITIEVMADDIAALLDQHDLAPAHVHGVLMGGLIAKTLALRHPDKVSTLVSCVSSAGLELPRAHFLLHTWRDMVDRQLPRDLINRFTATFLLSEEVFAYDRFMKAWVNADVDPFEQTREGFEQQMNAIKEYDIREKLGDISRPTLVAGSPGDMLVPFRYQEEVAAGIPNAELKRYAGGHVFMALPMFNGEYFEDLFAFWQMHDPLP